MANPSVSTTPTSTLDSLYKSQREFFTLGETRSLELRRHELERLGRMLEEHESEWMEALAADLGKSPFEAYTSELGFLLKELQLSLKNLKKWTRERKVPSPWVTWPSRSYIRPEAKGVCLIIAPWNYPLQLLFAPAISALAAGNTALLKPSEFTPRVAQLAGRLVSEYFDKALLAVIQGPGEEVVPHLLKQHRPDHVFFTGSTQVGKAIAELAAPKLIPVTLELGGKSPAVVESSARLKVAARRIAFGKWLNAGQTCVAPDYVLVQRSREQDFIQALQEVLEEFYPQGALKSPDYGRIIHRKHFQRLRDFLDPNYIVAGGEVAEESLQIAPTIMAGLDADHPVMEEEIFGPILPIIGYDKPSEAIRFIQQFPTPLALYVFSENKALQRSFIENLAFGGGAINSTVLHLSNPHLPFGGKGDSGMGQYHGKHGFETFSHQKSILKNATWLDLSMKYPPYTARALRLVKKIWP